MEYLYNNNGHPHFDFNKCILQVIDQRENGFTDEEKIYGKIVNGSFVIDTVKRDADLMVKIADAKRRLKTELKNKLDAYVNEALFKFPTAVRESFSAKYDEAVKLKSGVLTDTECLLIYSEAGRDNSTTTPTHVQCIALADAIIKNSEAFKPLAGAVSSILKQYTLIIDDPATDVTTYKLPDVLL